MKNTALLLTFCFFSSISFSQSKKFSLIDSVFSAWDQANTPGCALGIMKEGQLIYAKGYGLANMEYNIPNDANSVFRIGSTSKQFTAACIVLLAEQGKLSLESTLKEHFPDFPDYAKNITIQHLINHTSGIRDYLQLAYLKGLREEDFYTDTNIMNWLIHQSDLNFNPGEEFLYSNSGYWLLGQIVQKISGMNMAEYAQKEIFEPLHMNNTHFHNNHRAIVKIRASGYQPIANNQYEISMTTLDMIGDGGVFTTINDIKKWDDAYYNSPVLSRTFWQLMTEQGVLNNGETIDYASGLFIGTYKELKTIRHGGAFVGFRAELLRFPEQQVSIAIFANRADANPSYMADQVADIILEELLVEKTNKAEVSPKEHLNVEEIPLNQIIGNYEIQPGVNLEFSIEKDSLHVLQSWNKSTYTIVRIIGNSFQIPRADDLVFTFREIKDEATQTLVILQGDRETIAARKEPIDHSNMNLNDFIGHYYSKELDVTYSFKLEHESLILTINDNPPTECTIADTDQLLLNVGMAKFERKGNIITGFVLDSGRVKNLKFAKK